MSNQLPSSPPPQEEDALVSDEDVVDELASPHDNASSNSSSDSASTPQPATAPAAPPRPSGEEHHLAHFVVDYLHDPPNHEVVEARIFIPEDRDDWKKFHQPFKLIAGLSITAAWAKNLFSLREMFYWVIRGRATQEVKAEWASCWRLPEVQKPMKDGKSTVVLSKLRIPPEVDYDFYLLMLGNKPIGDVCMTRLTPSNFRASLPSEVVHCLDREIAEYRRDDSHKEIARAYKLVEHKFAAGTLDKLAKGQHLRKVAKTSESDLIEGEKNDSDKTLENVHTSIDAAWGYNLYAKVLHYHANPLLAQAHFLRSVV